jgi:hypothetical protein
VSETSEGNDEICNLGDCIREMQFYIYTGHDGLGMELKWTKGMHTPL